MITLTHLESLFEELIENMDLFNSELSEELEDLYQRYQDMK